MMKTPSVLFGLLMALVATAAPTNPEKRGEVVPPETKGFIGVEHKRGNDDGFIGVEHKRSEDGFIGVEHRGLSDDPMKDYGEEDKVEKRDPPGKHSHHKHKGTRPVSHPRDVDEEEKEMEKRDPPGKHSHHKHKGTRPVSHPRDVDEEEKEMEKRDPPGKHSHHKHKGTRPVSHPRDGADHWVDENGEEHQYIHTEDKRLHYDALLDTEYEA